MGANEPLFVKIPSTNRTVGQPRSQGSLLPALRSEGRAVRVGENPGNEVDCRALRRGETVPVSQPQYSKPRVIPANLYGYETPLISHYFPILNEDRIF